MVLDSLCSNFSDVCSDINRTSIFHINSWCFLTTLTCLLGIQKYHFGGPPKNTRFSFNSSIQIWPFWSNRDRVHFDMFFFGAHTLILYEKRNEIQTFSLNIHHTIIKIIKKGQGFSLLTKTINFMNTIHIFKFDLFCNVFQRNMCGHHGVWLFDFVTRLTKY
jgi:hypothetical protein